MALNPLGGAGPGSIIGAGTGVPVGGGKERFSQVLQGTGAPGSPTPARAADATDTPARANVTEARGVQRAMPGTTRVDGAPGPVTAQPVAARVLDRVTEAQRRMDEVLALAESGKSFSPAELLSLQAHVYRASQELDLAGKVVEKATNGVKQVLQTQV